MPLEIGSQLAHYTVTALIGAGGMGQVYQATSPPSAAVVRPPLPRVIDTTSAHVQLSDDEKPHR